MTARFCTALAILAILTVGCGTGSGNDRPPVATPNLALSKPKAALGSTIEATYRFVVAPDAPKLDQDYRVMVHFSDADGELMWTDDHNPPKPTTQWKPGETIEYQRTLFVPVYPYVGEAIVRMGLYSPADQIRLPLNGEENGQHAYKVATLEILPQSANVFLIFKEGWYGTESSPPGSNIEWHWTKQAATLSFRNPKRDSMFYVKLEGRPDLTGGSQQLMISSAGQPIETITLTSGDEVIRKIRVTAAQLGTADVAELTLAVDKTFVVPGDKRELGVRVLNAFLDPQ